MKITVITVCRNAAEPIAGCIRSVREQEEGHPDLEHWIIDGASTDDTLDVIESLRHDKLRVLSEPDEGLYDAMNKGLERATGDVIGFLHADDYYDHPGVLGEVAATLADPDIEACYADLCYVDPEDTSRVIRYWRSEPFRPGMFRRGWLPPHPTFFARRSVYKAHGGFDTRFRIGADWDLLLRLFEVKKIRARYVPGTWVRMRAGGVSNRSLGNIVRNNLECLNAFRKYGLRPSPAYFFAKPFHRLRQFVRREPASPRS